jgi:hypothetical protein
VARSGFLYLAGSLQRDTFGLENAVMVKTDLSGKSYWIEERDFGAQDGAFDIVADDNRIYAGVQTESIDLVSNAQMGYFSVLDTLVSGNSKEVVHDNYIKVFPNPSYDLIHIESDITVSRVNAFSTDGRIVNIPELGEGEYAIKHLPAGNYFLVIYDQEGKRYLSRIVKID